MSKRYRFFVVLAVLGVCFLFLLPTLRWYLFVPREQQAMALLPRVQIRDYVIRQANVDVQRLIQAMINGEDVPEDLAFVTAYARRMSRENRRLPREHWNARTVLDAFYSERAVLEVIEARYRDEIFALRRLHNNAVKLGLDLAGGLSIVLQADLNALEQRLGRPLTDDDRTFAMDSALGVLNSRIDQFGLTEPVIRRQGDEQILVEIPGTADPERINDIIMGRGSLAFHMEDEEATALFVSFYRANPATTFDAAGRLNPDLANILPYDVIIMGVYGQDRYGLDEQERNLDGSRRFVAVKREVGLDGNHIQEALVDRNHLDGRPEVTFRLDTEGADIFFRLTSANVDRMMAVVLDNRVRSRANIREPIPGGSVRVSGFGLEEANNLALMLRTAALPVELEVVSQQSIGASLGADTIRQGLYALLGGITLVLVFMLVFYRAAGINAVVAQLLNFYIMFSILSVLNFTLTLPAIAGFILTIGMATDANVLIFERIKEELRLGKSRKAAIEAGFGKAFWAIMDSNITTFIAALFLSLLGSGPIRGFAVTLSIGVFSSVFTALFVSRLIFDFNTDVFRSKKLAITWMPIQAQTAKGVS